MIRNCDIEMNSEMLSVSFEFEGQFIKKLTGRVGCSKDDIQILADILHCRKGTLPFKYLGLPLGASPRLVAFRDPVVEKFEKKLSTWKRQYLSFGGRITLIISSLSNLPVYYVSL